MGFVGPDGLTGLLLGAEGVPDIVTILNGPTGCKFYHSHFAHHQRGGVEIADPNLNQDLWFFGQPRIPCTYLDDADHLFGAGAKIQDILVHLSEHWSGLIVVIQAPGAALIGDDLAGLIRRRGLSDRCLSVETPGFSLSASEGVDLVIADLLDLVHRTTPRRTAPPPCDGSVPGKRVNLLGLSLLHRYPEGARRELTSLLSLLGTTVISSPGAGSAVSELVSSVYADANLLILPEYGVQTASWFSDRFQTPMHIPAAGAPVGFDATESWILEISALLGLDPTPALEMVTTARKRAAYAIARVNAISGLPRGCRYAVRAESSIAYPLCVWLYEYLGMVPAGIDLLPGGYEVYEQRLKSFLTTAGMDHVFGVFPGDDPDILFTDGISGTRYLREGRGRGVIEIGYPPSGRIELVQKTIFGVYGAQYMIEEILSLLR